MKDIDVDESQKTLWRYRSVLPKVNNIISLGEGYTPLQQLASDLYVKNETVNPTGSFKDRGMSLAVTLAKAQGVEEICLPSAGNAGISAAAYCKEAGIKCHVFLPETIPSEYKTATEKNSKNVYLSFFNSNFKKAISMKLFHTHRENDSSSQIKRKKKMGHSKITMKSKPNVESSRSTNEKRVAQTGWQSGCDKSVCRSTTFRNLPKYKLIIQLWESLHESVS